MSKFESYSDGSACLVIEPQERDAFKELIQRGANLWPDASPAIKELADLITEGKIMQDYWKQGNIPRGLGSPETLAGSRPPTAIFDDARPMQISDALSQIGSVPLLITTDSGTIYYGQFVGALAKKLPSMKEDLLHAAVGISGEAGELLDAIKKHWIYNKPLDYPNIAEELGDLMFYITAMIQICGFSLDQIIQENVTKLKARYADLNYSDAAAQARADKPGETAKSGLTA